MKFNKPYKVHQVATPHKLGPHDLLVKVAVASFCHTDMMVITGDFGTQLPCSPSHEGAGTVVAAGEDAQKLGWKGGERVMCGLHRNRCGTCEDCTGRFK